MANSRHNQARLLASIVTAIVLSCLAFPSLAQYDNGGWQIMQEGEVVGFLWTPARSATACESRQIWYLLPDYRYPGVDQPIETILIPAPEIAFEDERSFRTIMEEEFPGGHFVLTLAAEEREECG